MQISILQWNIWYQEDIENIASFIKQQNPDIVCLQELTIDYEKQSHADTPGYVAGILGYNKVIKSFPTNPDGSNVMANGIFTRFPIKSSRSILINESRGTDGYEDEPRTYVEADIDVGGITLKVGTVHMSYTHKFHVTDRKKQETRKLFDTIKGNTSRYIITGDFNMIPGSDEIIAFETKYLNLGPPLDEKTWTTKPFSYDGFEETELNWRLDYVFGTKDLKIVSTKTLPSDYSDHLSLLTVIEL